MIWPIKPIASEIAADNRMIKGGLYKGLLLFA